MTRTITVSVSAQGGYAKYHFDNLYVLDNYVRGMVPGQPFERSAVRDARVQLLAVFDGMGEGELGVEASRTAAEILDRHRIVLEHNPEVPFKDFVRAFVEEANTALCDGIRRNRGLRMGASFSLLCIRDGIARTANIGNTRAFLYRGESLIQMTYDHTQAQRLVRLGIIGPDEARTHPERDVLTQYLGIFPEEMALEPSYGPTVILQKGDTFVLASNSVTEVLANESLRLQIATADVFSTLPHRMIQQAEQAGSRDNLSVLAVRVLETDTQQAQIAAGSMVDVTTQIPAGEIERALAAGQAGLPPPSQRGNSEHPVADGESEHPVTPNRARVRIRAILIPIAWFVLFAFVGAAAAKLMFSWDSWFGGRPTRVTTSLRTTLLTTSSPAETQETTTPAIVEPTTAPTESEPPVSTTPPSTTPASTAPTTEATIEATTVPTTQTTAQPTPAPTTTEPTEPSAPTPTLTTPSPVPTTASSVPTSELESEP